MKNVVKALLSSSLLLTNLCMAEPLNRLVVAEHCRVVSADLSQLADHEKATWCADIVKTSAAYLDKSCVSLWQNNPTDALTQLHAAVRHLIGLSSSTLCVSLARQTPPYLMMTMQLENEIQAIT